MATGTVGHQDAQLFQHHLRAKLGGLSQFVEGHVCGASHLTEFRRCSAPGPDAPLAGLALIPFLFATGHGKISFSIEEKERLRKYLVGGGFLFVNDSYGMDAGFRQEMSQLFPEREVVEIPYDHPLYHCFYDFPNGPPKIHEHDKKPPRGYGIIINGRVVLYFLVESDIGDGWEDEQVHKDPPEKRDAAMRMAINIVAYALTH